MYWGRGRLKYMHDCIATGYIWQQGGRKKEEVRKNQEKVGTVISHPNAALSLHLFVYHRSIFTLNDSSIKSHNTYLLNTYYVPDTV